jgi:hypothetical protein
MNDEKEKEQNMRVSFKKTMSITALTLVMTFAPPSQAFFLMIAEAIAAAVEAVKTSQTVIRVTRTVNNVVKGVKAVQSVIKKTQTAVKTVQTLARPTVQYPPIQKATTNFAIRRI